MFSISQEEWDKFKEWAKEQDNKVSELQKNTEFFKFGVPYYGATGGGYTYCFTPTSLGLVVKIRNNITKEELDLTDYDSW